MVRDHRTAIEYDLLTLTGYTTDDIGGALPWSALFSFIRHLPLTSALQRELNPEVASWCAGEHNASILADLWDLVAHVNTQRGHTPPKYPRPKPISKTERQIGANPLPIKDFDAWWNS